MCVRFVDHIVISTEALAWSSHEVKAWINKTMNEGKTDVLDALGNLDGRGLLNVTKEQLIHRGLSNTLCDSLLNFIEEFQRGNNPFPFIYMSEKRNAVTDLIKDERKKLVFAKDPKTWTVADVLLWLHVNRLSEYKNFFIVQKINGSSLVKLTEQDLVNIGIKIQRHRTFILILIAVSCLSINSLTL